MSTDRRDEPVLHVVAADRLPVGLAACVVALYAESHADADRLREALRRPGTVALAFEDGRLVGFAVGDRRDPPRSPVKEGHRAGVVCVAAGHRRRGLARLLLARAGAPQPATAACAVSRAQR